MIKMDELEMCMLRPDPFECQLCLRIQNETGIILCEECKWYNEVFTIIYSTKDYVVVSNGEHEFKVTHERIIKNGGKKYEN